jgi:hypothetical protein
MVLGLEVKIPVEASSNWKNENKIKTGHNSPAESILSKVSARISCKGKKT